MSRIKTTLSTAAAIAALCALAPETPAQKTPIPVKCSKDRIKSAWSAKSGNFEIKTGLAVETRSGYVGRAKLPVVGKCLLEAEAGDTVMLVFDEKHKRELQISSYYEMQCVDAVKPTGKFLGYTASPQMRRADGKSWTPPCSAAGLNKLEKKACSKGVSNRERWDRFKELEAKSKTFAVGFYIQDDPGVYTRESEPYVGSDRSATTAKEVAPSGKLFCQLWSKQDKDVLFAVTFDVPGA
jgi:hypothetical protein